MKAKAKETSARIGLAALAGAGMTFAFPALAFAAEEESSGGLSAILPDMAEFIPMLVIFILLWIVLAKFGWPKFEAMLEKREMTIKDSLEKSEQARVESERVLEEYKRQLEDAKAQAAQIVADAKKTGEAVKADITDKAQSEATAMIEKAHNAIEAEKKAAISELQGSVADLSVFRASRLIGEDLNDAEHRKIIERYVNEAGSFTPTNRQILKEKVATYASVLLDGAYEAGGVKTPCSRSATRPSASCASRVRTWISPTP